MNQKVALVLGSGGARGLAHIGVIEALMANGFEISSLAGSSIGAVVGGCYARGKLDAAKNWFGALDKFGLFGLLDFTLSRQGLVKGDKLFDNLKTIIGDRLIDDLYLPYVAIATDINQSKEIIFRHGSLFTAMRASVAIPSFITPFFYHGKELVDGGICNPLPINRVHRHRGDICIAVDINANIPYEAPPVKQNMPSELNIQGEQGTYEKNIKTFISFFTQNQTVSAQKQQITSNELGFFELINRSFDIMQDHMAEQMLQNHPPDVLIKISRKACGTLDFYKIDEMIEAGKKATISALREKGYLPRKKKRFFLFRQ
ncbi:patatin-like phospholipase family protein [Persicobacter diffluens]|uniref:Serine protease n=1 Tax=Persicobacter diffluens TaxID=981 RepID=A0AAN4W099_9BACT|nr:serine protease [Persicobacter diffluens]